MGALGFDDFCELLKFRAGNNPALDAAGVSALNYYGIWTNSAYRQLCTQDKIFGMKKNLYFPQLMTSATKLTTDSTPYVATPSDCLYIEDIFDTTNGKNLDWIPWSVYLEYTDRTDTSAEGDATEWTRYGSNIYLHPTPGTTGDTLTIYYKKLVADLSGTQTTAIGAEWDDVIIELAAYKMFTWTHEYDKAKLVKEAFLEMSAGLADIYSAEEKDTGETWQPSNSYMPRRR
jgi:hypothetical protein